MQVYRLFGPNDIRQLMAQLEQNLGGLIEQLDEDELLNRSTEDLVNELCPSVELAPIELSDDPVDGRVEEVTVDVSQNFAYDGLRAKGTRVTAVYAFTGDQRLFRHRPTTYISIVPAAEVRGNSLEIWFERPGSNFDPASTKAALDQEIGRIRQMVEFAGNDARSHNQQIRARAASTLDQRRVRIQQNRSLAGALGFPLVKRSDAPLPVPMVRKTIGVARRVSPGTKSYIDEPALTNAQYEDAIEVVRHMLLAMERTPSVAAAKSEEDLRDQILVQLNGTFEGAATGETFVQRGKTDILVRVEDRHVFVGECKWWGGPKACGEAVDQLLSYLPWRDEKAALILFIDRKDASQAIDKADQAVRDHQAFKRGGPASIDPSTRRNFVLGHPDDRDREIHLAVLFAVLPKA